ncbi:hypothetical protein JCGZ_05372 [Jatropha curcas]|uniref:Aminotransferase-like plant mobile domain-containing protein n=1 Tax=Jatropha curcas TaxID=180498 RepID=A0A067JKE8_JATCU|nr:hypothetical protein JCGZ_05372 [Jatropha curcas]
MTPIDFSMISGIPFGIQPIELYDDWRIDISSNWTVELIGIDLPRLVEPEEYDWAGAILSRMYDDMCDLSRGHGKLSGTFYFWEVEVELMPARLQGWIQADPDFQWSDALSQRRVVPDGLVNQMMELVLGMQQELAAAWTQIAFDD